MDKRCKGLSWVGNIYQKFEDMCMEVDDIMTPQETFKYVENQFNTVGANVKQFWSDLVQDVLSSMNTNEKEDPNSSLLRDTLHNPCEKSMGEINEDNSKKELLHSSSDEPSKEVYFDLSSEQSVATGKKKKSEESAKEDSKQNCSQLKGSDMISPMEKDLGDAMLSRAADDATGISSSIKFGEESGNLDAADDAIGISSSMEFGEGSGNLDDSACTSGAMHSLVKSFEGEDLDILLNSNDVSAESGVKSNGAITEEVNDLTKLDAETIQSFDKVKLCDSYVPVDSTELSSVSHEAERQLSFKKKFIEAYTSRRREAYASRKRAEMVGSAKKSESLDYEFSESDWEIV
ncbi:hypothetical protein CFOL_v3_00914 [Cephalotus follicularis]|uniref:Uncharacterized protein n=1 Tax=Cephalotus follicularis TaxID=3775 RepID=A0A1Q3ANQ2_CEPFO|nr:hypothetical protein CFOL_v3_00914 [Cephalotus follicularis]